MGRAFLFFPYTNLGFVELWRVRSSFLTTALTINPPNQGTKNDSQSKKVRFVLGYIYWQVQFNMQQSFDLVSTLASKPSHFKIFQHPFSFCLPFVPNSVIEAQSLQKNHSSLFICDPMRKERKSLNSKLQQPNL